MNFLKAFIKPSFGASISGFLFLLALDLAYQGNLAIASLTIVAILNGAIFGVMVILLAANYPPVSLPLLISLRCGLISGVGSLLINSTLPGQHLIFPSYLEASGVGGLAIFTFFYVSALGGYSICDIFSSPENKRLTR